MNFTVQWEPDAWRELTYVWATAPDPAAVRAARDTAEAELGRDPFGAGRPLSEGLWLAHVPPLLVYYTIDSNGKRVDITDVVHTAPNP